ncbi:DUF4189 domain-containing protein [Lysobacter pythonis]|uniref:DUF4189 domain-containing protein n=1 Tax=Solilutibacter pythonis TaxID=2483112 RepID=A0A3M2HYS4_9GAMM|nr:DUF4189 domain-containing protein [Lysobacter pythonis]
MKKPYSINFLAILFFLGAASNQVAASPCPPGSVPIPGEGRCGAPAEASAIRSSSGSISSAPIRSEIWENRFGAVALGDGKGLGGVIEGARSEREARRTALSRCTQARCEVVSLVRNGCQAVASSNIGSGYGRAESERDAADEAMKNCLAQGGQCSVGYSGCSLPVRVR